MKYRGAEELCRYMGKQLGIKLSGYESLSSIDMIIPVPLHPKKQRNRGYNQSTRIAEGISEVLQKPVISNNLVRIEDNTTQTNKSRQERWQNVNEIFALTEVDRLVDTHVLLVDDVITTGATLEACCNVLNKANKVTISIATLATA